MPKETGMMFKGPLVRAILEGRKTQTRRLVKPQPAPNHAHDGGTKWVLEQGLHVPVGSVGHLSVREKTGLRCPIGQPGDLIYVRETWQGPLLSTKEWEDHYFSNEEAFPSRFKTPAYCQYAADGGPPPEFTTMDDETVARWKPSIHMPKWAARIWLEITGVRIEQLHSISQADAIAEGAPPSHPSIDQVSMEFGYSDFSRSWFAQTWESTGASWSANPWVWVYEFKTISK